MRGDRGQSLVLAALLLGAAALAVALLARSQDGLLSALRDARAGEAAVAAAGAAVAELQAERVRELGRDLDARETEVFAADERVREAARAAASAMARTHGRPGPTEFDVRAFGIELEVRLVVAGRPHVALLEPPE